MTSYFTPSDVKALQDWQEQDSPITIPEDLQPLVTKLADLHETMSPNLKGQNFPLSRYKTQIYNSATSHHPVPSVSIQYLRDVDMALRVERLMGREEVTPDGIETHRHPLIELRVTANSFTIELVLSPDAWWDQQNIVGKLSHNQHRGVFYQQIQKLGVGVSMGYWEGIELSDMRLQFPQFMHTRILNEWISTFAVSKDWFRIGKWYELDQDELNEDRIADEVSEILVRLYAIYDTIAWRSENNYRNFYKPATK